MELKDVISIVSFIFTAIIAIFTFRLNSEQTKIKHVLKNDIMNRFLSCYRNINQLNDYIWRAYKIGSPINRDFVLEFYSKKAFELSDIQSTGRYFYILKMLETFMIGANIKSEKQNIMKSYESYVKASKAEYTYDVNPFLNDYLNKKSNREVNEVLREHRYNT